MLFGSHMCVQSMYLLTQTWMWVFISCVHAFQWAPCVILHKINDVDIYIVLRIAKYFFNRACKSFKSMVTFRILDVTVRREFQWVMLSWVRLWRTSTGVISTWWFFGFPWMIKSKTFCDQLIFGSTNDSPNFGLIIPDKLQ